MLQRAISSCGTTTTTTTTVVRLAVRE